MFKNPFVQMLVELQKSGTTIYLTEAGYKEFLNLLRDETFEIVDDAAI